MMEANLRILRDQIFALIPLLSDRLTTTNRINLSKSLICISQQSPQTYHQKIPFITSILLQPIDQFQLSRIWCLYLKFPQRANRWKPALRNNINHLLFFLSPTCCSPYIPSPYLSPFYHTHAGSASDFMPIHRYTVHFILLASSTNRVEIVSIHRVNVYFRQRTHASDNKTVRSWPLIGDRRT